MQHTYKNKQKELTKCRLIWSRRLEERLFVGEDAWAVREWMDLYYGASRSGEDGSARLAVLIVSKLCRTFAEYDVHRDKHDDWAQECYTDALNKVAKTAMQYALIGGECLLKVVDDHFRADPARLLPAAGTRRQGQFDQRGHDADAVRERQKICTFGAPH